VIALLKRWLLGTHQGEFTFRFNRRKSKSRGKLFYRLAQQAVVVGPVPFATTCCAWWRQVDTHIDHCINNAAILAEARYAHAKTDGKCRAFGRPSPSHLGVVG
jgi:hypothetical protein